MTLKWINVLLFGIGMMVMGGLAGAWHGYDVGYEDGANATAELNVSFHLSDSSPECTCPKVRP